MSIETTSWIFSLILAKITRFALLMSFGAVACARARHVGACEIRAARKLRRPRRRADLLERAAQLDLDVLEVVDEQNVLAVVEVARRAAAGRRPSASPPSPASPARPAARRFPPSPARPPARACRRPRAPAAGPGVGARARNGASGSVWPCMAAPMTRRPRDREGAISPRRGTHRARQCQRQEGRNSHRAPNTRTTGQRRKPTDTVPAGAALRPRTPAHQGGFGSGDLASIGPSCSHRRLGPERRARAPAPSPSRRRRRRRRRAQLPEGRPRRRRGARRDVRRAQGRARRDTVPLARHASRAPSSGATRR